MSHRTTVIGTVIDVQKKDWPATTVRGDDGVLYGTQRSGLKGVKVGDRVSIATELVPKANAHITGIAYGMWRCKVTKL